MNRFELRRLRQNLESIRIRFEILSSGFQRNLHDLIFVGAIARHHQLTLALKQSADRSRRCDATSAFGDNAADFCCCPVAIIRLELDKQGDAVRRINLVGQILDGHAAAFTQALLDGALDIFRRHVGGAALQQHHAEARVHVPVAAALPCDHRDFLGELRKDFATLRVNRAFETLHLCPFTVSSHALIQDFKVQQSARS